MAMFRLLDLAFWRAQNHLGPSSLRSREKLDEALLHVQRFGRIAELKERHLDLLH